jgi:hypothetical protein
VPQSFTPSLKRTGIKQKNKGDRKIVGLIVETLHVTSLLEIDASPLFLAPRASVLKNLYDVRLITLNKNLDPSPCHGFRKNYGYVTGHDIMRGEEENSSKLEFPGSYHGVSPLSLVSRSPLPLQVISCPPNYPK